ncbi:MAG: MBL fold metallo-hydrolase [Anaerolineaceae bacterium]|nr:MBL fold metallo-hydrolase [Anaerolineaceae bacterium]
MNILNVGYTSTNYYVLADAKPRLLIDVGFAGTLPKLQHELKRMGVQLAGIKHLLATHYHPDHAGLAAELQGMGIKLIVVDVQQEAIAAVQDDLKLAKQYVGFDKNAAVMITLDESRAFLATLGIHGEIIATPGHSNDSISLILDTGEAFTGDLTHPMMAGEGESGEVIKQSWDAIRAHGAKSSYPGHGPVYALK